ncbi:hypothetical protein [Devosia nitrariae]|uniref:Uncharacterized protein n=1 Tax=Devosia nitrariae TaxID=2071872 RepID=A0ABQ5VZZ7_9HYPH|nr:hypothetical protein [Devosia nitrariae]GLQ53226.1 hypothetical protein GCM10010862_04840 [Devosia nitrariae]
MSQPTSITQELAAAARGFVALVTGNRHAADHFDFSQRGLVGSFIALILASVITAFGPGLLGVPSEPGTATRSIFLGASLFVLQMGVVYFVLRQMGRLDGFIPYLVADNWVSLFIALLTVLVLRLIGAGDFTLLAIGLVAIIIEINIARVIVTLAPMQIVIFIGAQFAAQFLGVLILASMIPGATAPAV